MSSLACNRPRVVLSPFDRPTDAFVQGANDDDPRADPSQRQSFREWLATVAALFLFAAGCSKTSEGKPEVPQPASRVNGAKPGGDKAALGKPAVVKEVDLAGFQGVLDGLKDEKKVVFVDFWGTWCGNCRAAFPHTVDLGRKYAKDGLAVVSVAIEDDPNDEKTRKEIVDFLTEQGADFTHLRSRLPLDEAFTAFEIGETGLPHYRVYGRDGELARKFIAGDPEMKFTPADIEAAIRAALGLPEEGAKPAKAD